MAVKKRGSPKTSSASNSPKRGKKKEVSKVEEKPVNSKIEHTSPDTKRSTSHKLYRKSVKDLGVELEVEAIKRADQNLLTAKLGLWEALGLVEKKLRERRG